MDKISISRGNTFLFGCPLNTLIMNETQVSELSLSSSSYDEKLNDIARYISSASQLIVIGSSLSTERFIVNKSELFFEFRVE